MTDPLLLPAPRRIGSTTTGALPPQGYRLVVHEGGHVDVEAADDSGRFYAQQTLAQLGPEPSPVVIEDWPDLEVRGVMLDVSRDKVPTLDTLKALVERLASWKINQVQLYLEHTFAYTGHDDVWRTASPFTAEDIRELDAYCAARFVELVPNQNCLGHMERWLRVERYKPLAIRPDGWTDQRGRARPPTTLDPSNPASLELVRSMLTELVPNFSSERIHVGLDEPWELPDERFDDYLAFIAALRGLRALEGREMLMWGDIVAQHPERASELPPGVTICEWGYEANHPFPARAMSLAERGLPFWLCPGTSSWNTIVGRWSNMRENCLRAADAAIEHGASGYLVTDWGDNGHLQYLPISEPAFAWAAAVSWCAEANRDVDLVEAASAHVFGDPTGALMSGLRQLGDAHLASTPQLPNMSVLMLPLLVPRLRVGEGYTDGLDADQLDAAAATVARARHQVASARSTRADASLVADELENAAELLATLVDDARARLTSGGALDTVSLATRRELASRLRAVLDRHRELWLQRNRPGGLDDSCSRLLRLIDAHESLD